MINSNVEQLFSKTYILGGSPCNGKSTMAESVVFSIDSVLTKQTITNRNICSVPNESVPVMFQYSKMGWDLVAST
jgi:hypothetical protein